MKEWMRKNSGSMLALTVVVIVALIMFLGGVNVTLGDDAIRIRATFFGGKTIAYEDITDIQLTDNFTPGSRTLGIGSARLRAGTFNNGSLGTYSLYAYNGVPTHIVINSTNGYVVVNCDSDEKTQALYEQLLEKIA